MTCTWLKYITIFGSAVETVNILFLGGAKRVSLAERLISAGEKRQLNVAIFSYELSSLVPIMQVGRVIKGKRWSDPDLIKHLEDTITNHDINVVLPFVDPAINICAILKCVLAQTTLRSDLVNLFVTTQLSNFS
jgi:carbamoyl-phosphate synthase large subunit